MDGTKTVADSLATYENIPADIRWMYIREGLAHSIERAQFTLRTGAANRGSFFITRGQTEFADAGHSGLFGRTVVS